jgi:thiosulfate/3-mercaptopyruvate sulfurtransferase
MRRTRVVPAVASLLLWANHHRCAALAGAQAPDPRAAITVSTAWLAEHLKDPDLVLLHVGDPYEYVNRHIPGARLVGMRDVSVTTHDHQTNAGLSLELPAPDSLRARLQALGISDRSRVVVYYADDWVSPATRVLFTLDAAGLGARAALVDGGLTACRSASRARCRR